jgi:hypothetical protein
VKVAWTLPTDNGSPITEYKLFIKEIGSNSYTYRSSVCDGTQATVISNSYCLVDVTELINSFNLDGGHHVYAKVSAINVYGESQ